MMNDGVATPSGTLTIKADFARQGTTTASLTLSIRLVGKRYPVRWAVRTGSAADPDGLTGVPVRMILTNDGGVSIGRERKRLLRAMVHQALTNATSEEDRKKLLGWMAFANAVEPAFMARLRAAYGEDFVNRI